MSDNNADRLKEHEIIRKIKHRHDISNQDLKHIRGYVADSPVKDCVRLFTTLNFDICVDIPKKEIIHVEEVSKDIMEFGGTSIWVTKKTELTYTKVDRTKIEAQFLEGKLMQDYLPIASDLDFRGRQFPTIISTAPCEIIEITIKLSPIIIGAFTPQCSRHCPSQYATCRSQAGCGSCTA